MGDIEPRLDAASGRSLVLLLGVAGLTATVAVMGPEVRALDPARLYTLSLAVAVVTVVAVGTVSARALWTTGFLYLFMLVAFHLGVPMTRAIGDRPLPGAYDNLWFKDNAAVDTAIWLSLLAILAFTLGYLALSLGRTAETVHHPADQPDPTTKLAPVALTLMLVGAGLYMAYAALEAPALYLGAGKAYFEQTIAGSGPIALGTILTSIAVVMAAAARPSPARTWALRIFVVFAVFTLVIGSRTAALYSVVALLIVLARVRPTMPSKRVAIAAILGGLVLISGVQQIRDTGISGASASELVGSPVAAVREMGATLRPVTETVAAVDFGAEQRNGQTYFVGLIRLYERATGIERPNPDPRWADSITTSRDDGYQIGYSTVAESYLNFGALGTLLAFLLLGGVFARWDRTRLGDRLYAARVGVVFVALSAAIRQSSNIVLTTIILGLLAVAFVRWWSLAESRKSATTPRATARRRVNA